MWTWWRVQEGGCWSSQERVAGLQIFSSHTYDYLSTPSLILKPFWIFDDFSRHPRWVINHGPRDHWYVQKYLKKYGLWNGFAQHGLKPGMDPADLNLSCAHSRRTHWARTGCWKMASACMFLALPPGLKRATPILERNHFHLDTAKNILNFLNFLNFNKFKKFNKFS